MEQIFILLAAFSAAVFAYAIITLLLSSNEKLVMKSRFSRYLKKSDVEEVQDQVFKEKHDKAKKKKNKNIQLASKEFTNYLLMSGVKLSAKEYLNLWAFSVLGPSLLVLMIRGNLITVLGVGIVGFAIPPVFVQRSRKKRQEEFNKQLGESLAVMGNCIRAGFTFQQAMESIASEMQPPISVEFSRALREIHYGVSLEDALNHMVERVKNKDLDLLVSAVLTSARVGGNLSDILEVISETVKDRIKIKAEVRVLTSSGRASGLIIGLLPVFIIIILMVINPEYITAFAETTAGKVMLCISVVLEAAGFTIINKIVDIKY